MKLGMKEIRLWVLLLGMSWLIAGCCEITGDCEPVEPVSEPTSNGTGLEPLSDNLIQNIPMASPPAGGNLPNSVDLSNDMPPVGAQGSANSCVGWAVGYALKSYQEKIEFGYNYSNSNGTLNSSKVFSPTYIYNQIKLNNCGYSYIADAFDILLNQGVCSLQDMPYTVSDCETQPNQNQRQAASSQSIESYQRVDVTNPDNFKAFLYASTPIVFGMRVDQEFSRANNNNGEFIWRANSTNDVGNHAMVLVGYDDGRNAYKVLNSWGTDWGNDGYIWIDYALFMDKLLGNEAYVAMDRITNTNDTKVIEVSGNLNFGMVTIGQQTTKDFKIRNIGTEALTVSSINIPNGYTANWNNGNIAPGNEVTVTLTFSPQSASNYNGTIVVNSDAQSGINTITVTGIGGSSGALQFTDSRDGKTYNYIQIGTTYWMAENLNYDSGNSNSACYGDNNNNCTQYGRLYNWQEVMQGAAFSNNTPSGVQGICPNGWHLPSYNEWNNLMNEFDDGDPNNFTIEIYNALIENGSSGFEAKIGGFYSHWGTYDGLNTRTRFWTASEFNWGIPYAFYASAISTSVELKEAETNNKFYCRCVQD